MIYSLKAILSKSNLSEVFYHPSKDTELAVCIGLKLNYSEARELLKISGYSFAANSQRDLTIVYALSAGVCRICEVNNLLRDLGEKLFKE